MTMLLSLLRKLYEDTENLKGKKLVVVLAGVFIVFLFIGISIGYITDFKLTENEPDNSAIIEPGKKDVEKVDSFEGRVMYIDPKTYPNENIKYALYDSEGNELVLLKSADQKLDILEGMYVKVNGKLSKSASGKKDVLNVTEVIMNASN